MKPEVENSQSAPAPQDPAPQAPVVVDADSMEFGKRPSRKPDIVLRGKLDVWNDEGQYAFTSAKQNPALKREVVFEKNGVKLSKTAGEKESSYILSAKVDAESADPEGELMHKVYEQLKSRTKKIPQIPNANFLLNDEGNLQIWRRKNDKRICVFLSLDVQAEKSTILENLMDKVSTINKIISKNT